ncbi:MAG: beta-hydroxyacyl-ACP dehydratase [Myxococcales bacterium]|nr:beta-hydroxyacyl-ACP dehydratase [Myxococcales bacterium]
MCPTPPVDPITGFPDIETLIPHRAPHRHVSRIVSVDGLKAVAEGDFMPADVSGHFPGRPIIPGVVMVESLAQTLCALATLSGEHGQMVLTGVEKARFRGMASPPCTLRFEVEVTERRLGLTWAKGRVLRGADLLCSATLQAAMVPEDVVQAALKAAGPLTP